MTKFPSIGSPDKQHNTVRRFFKTALTFIATDPVAEHRAVMASAEQALPAGRPIRREQ